MAQQDVLLKAKGLYSFPNRLSSVPQGALLKAVNLVINRDDIAESRRGFKIYGNAIGSTVDDIAHQLMTYKDRLIRHYGPGSGTTLEVDDGAGTFTPFTLTLTGDTHSNTTIDNLVSTAELSVGTFISGSGVVPGTTIISIDSNSSITISVATGTSLTGTSLVFSFDVAEVDPGLRIKSIEQNGNLYFTTDEGIRKISVASAADLTSAIITDAGGIKALDTTLAINANPGFLEPDSAVAYRVVWGIKDASQNLILGAPSGRVTIKNTDPSFSKTVDVTFTIPQKITTAYFYQIYRTAIVSNVNSFQITGDTNSNTTITNVADTSSLVVGMDVSGTDIVPGTTITSISSTSTFELSIAATGSTPGVTLTVSITSDIDPGDEEALVYEANPTLADLNAGFIMVTDITPESFRGANLYTNANSGEGIAQSNDVPPLAKDITSYKGYTFYANTKTRYRLSVSLLSVANFVAGVSTLTITDGTTSNTYTFDVTQDVATKKVLISTLPTPAQQVEETAQSLVHIINAQAGEIVSAFYLSGPSDVPGLILLEARGLNQDAFYLNVDDAATTGIEFSPNIPASGQDVIADDEISPNRIYYSKFQQPEAVPLLNYIDVGPKDKNIIRVIALRDSLFVMKEEGVYRLSGSEAPFQVFPFDFSTNIKAADSAVVLNNLIYIFSNQGITTVSDTGVAIISRPIEDEVIKLLTTQFVNFTTATFGLSYESDRAYYLFTVKNPADVYATQCFRFNTFTNTFTQLDLTKRCGIVNPADDLIYLGATDLNFLEQERKNFQREDFADRQYTIALSTGAVIGNEITLPSVANITVGDVITQMQYLTITTYNRLLTKLDRDSLLTHSYVADLHLDPGIDMSVSMDNLINQIANDASRLAVPGATLAATYTALTPTPSTFSGQQTTFNSLVTLLNADTGVGYGDYAMSSSTVLYELPVIAVNTSASSITTDFTYPLITGDIISYAHINTELQFVPQYLSDVSMTKQVSEGTFIFEDSSFTNAIVSYSSDLSADFESVTISGNGPGTFGNFEYGQGIYGGNGAGTPFRTYIPRDKQRCRYINPRFQHGIAREVFSLYGISLSFQPTSNRGYR